LQALEKYESNPEDVGEAFQEWVSKTLKKKKKDFDYQDFASKVLCFFCCFVFKFFVFLYFLLYFSHKMNKMCQLHIIFEDILMVSAANQNRAFSLSIVLVFNKIASPYQLEKIKSLSFISLF